MTSISLHSWFWFILLPQNSFSRQNKSPTIVSSTLPVTTTFFQLLLSQHHLFLIAPSKLNFSIAKELGCADSIVSTESQQHQQEHIHVLYQTLTSTLPLQTKNERDNECFSKHLTETNIRSSISPKTFEILRLSFQRGAKASANIKGGHVIMS